MPSSDSGVTTLLSEAVTALGGQERAGQVEMAEAVATAFTSGEHLLVQAGTGTGKSLGYLVPALLHHDRVVVATATLALQHQLVERDIPALVEAAADVLGTDATYAVLKGRSNYACLHRVREGVPDDQGVLVDIPESSTGAEVVALLKSGSVVTLIDPTRTAFCGFTEKRAAGRISAASCPFRSEASASSKVPRM